MVTGIAAETQSELIPGYYFMDVNAKVNFSIQKKHHFYASYYTGQDKLFAKIKSQSLSSEMNQGWGNTIASTRYQSVSDNGAFNDASIYYSSFKEFDSSELNTPGNTLSQKNVSNLNEIGFKTSREWSSKSYLTNKVGVNGLWRSIQTPYKIIEEDNSTKIDKNTALENQKELSAFALSKYARNKFEMQFGLRASMFGEQL